MYVPNEGLSKLLGEYFCSKVEYGATRVAIFVGFNHHSH